MILMIASTSELN